MTHAASKSVAHATPRRSQAQRSSAMRERLLQATLACLRDAGHAETSVSRIVERAGVSRGAYLHHYPTKDALLADAAAYLMSGLSQRLAQAVRAVDPSQERLPAVLERGWKELFCGPDNDIYLELLLACRRDAALAGALRSLSLDAMRALDQAGRQFLEPKPRAGVGVGEMLRLTQWLLRGMALDHALSDDPHDFSLALRAWGRILAANVKMRRSAAGVPRRAATPSRKKPA
jgi:AcrR family transcriptional regulator